MGKLRTHLTYANVMSTIAVFGVLAGGTAAAFNLNHFLNQLDNRINAGMLKANSVRNQEIADKAVDSDKVANRSLRSEDFDPDDLPVGPAGPPGEPGAATGAAGGDLTGSFPDPSIAPDAVTSGKIADGSLRAVDIGRAQIVNFEGNIGGVPFQSCKASPVTGIPATGDDHLILTAHFGTSHPDLSYTAQYLHEAGEMRIVTCNPTTGGINDGNTNFSLLIIDPRN